jgi:hypothetical protein
MDQKTILELEQVMRQLSESAEALRAILIPVVRDMAASLGRFRQGLVDAGVVRAECNCPPWMTFHAMNCAREDLACTPQKPEETS